MGRAVAQPGTGTMLLPYSAAAPGSVQLVLSLFSEKLEAKVVSDVPSSHGANIAARGGMAFAGFRVAAQRG